MCRLSTLQVIVLPPQISIALNLSFPVILSLPIFAMLQLFRTLQVEHINVRFIADSSAYISKYVLLRADSLNGTYVPVDSLLNNLNLYDFTFSDLNVSPGKQSYAYKVEVFDSCGILSVTSNVGKTIYLLGKPGNNLSNSLTWNPYFQWDGQVSGYKLYRSFWLPAQHSLLLILSLPMSLLFLL